MSCMVLVRIPKDHVGLYGKGAVDTAGVSKIPHKPPAMYMCTHRSTDGRKKDDRKNRRRKKEQPIAAQQISKRNLLNGRDLGRREPTSTGPRAMGRVKDSDHWENPFERLSEVKNTDSSLFV